MHIVQIMQKIIQYNLFPSKNNEHTLKVIIYHYFIIIFHYFFFTPDIITFMYSIIICNIYIIYIIFFSGIILQTRKASVQLTRNIHHPPIGPASCWWSIPVGRWSWSDGIGLDAPRIRAWRPLRLTVPAVTFGSDPCTEFEIFVALDAREGQALWCRSVWKWTLTGSVAVTS